MKSSAKIRLVAIDLDGTLLNSSKGVTEATAAVLRDAQRMVGLRIVLASARPPRSVMPFYSLLDLDTPMINYNGALVYDPTDKRVVMHRPIPCDTARQIVAIAREAYPDVLVSAEVMDQWFTDRLSQTYLTQTAMTHKPDLVAPIDQWLNQPITKLLLLGEQQGIKMLSELLSRRFLHQVAMVQTEMTLLQIMHATVSKAAALKTVAAELGLEREQVMAIGDNANDVGMLLWAGIGVAMANAAPEVIAAADYVTDHHDADGVAKAIREIVVKGSSAKKRKAK